jgi:hypothetical protein
MAKKIAATKTKKEPARKSTKKPSKSSQSKQTAAVAAASRSSSNSSEGSSSARAPAVKICHTLTEAYIKEHNIHHGSLGRGGGSSFTHNTKMYIIKWTMENVPTDEAPFEKGIIDIDTFGTKVLDDPQYLKSKQGRAHTAKATTDATAAPNHKKSNQDLVIAKAETPSNFSPNRSQLDESFVKGHLKITSRNDLLKK